MSDWDFNYAHIGCQFCRQANGHIHRFDLVNGAEFAHVNCFDEHHAKMAAERIRASLNTDQTQSSEMSEGKTKA